MRTTSIKPVRSVSNALRVIEAFNPNEMLGVSELARRIALPKATTQRMLVTLQDAGWVVSTETSPTRWEPSTNLLAMGSRFFQGWGLRVIASPIMREVRDRTREAVSLVVRQGRHVVYVDRVDSPQPVQATGQIGLVVPMHTSSSGKAILARFSDAEVRKLLGKTLDRYTEKTIVTHAALFEELRKVRDCGYAIGWQEYRPEIVSVGAAVLNDARTPVAGISITVPAMRMSRKRSRELGIIIATAANSISERLRGAS